jgi:simple sugar transport system substrate-binding protein
MKRHGLLAAILSAILLFGTAAFAAGPGAGIKIVFFPGGSEGGPFASIVYNGAKAAQDVLGCDVEYIWSGWNSEKMIAQFKEAIARKPDGIAIMGHPGVTAYAPLVDMARKKGIIVTSQNTDLPSIENKYKADGFGYVGQELFASGAMLAQGAFRKAGLKKGDRAMVWGLMGQEGRGERTRGAVEKLKELGIQVDYLEISDEINADASLGAPVFSSYVISHPDVKLVITDHGALTATAATYMKSARKKAGDIYIAGFDLSPATVDAIRQGWVGVVLDQQPWLQGYIPIFQIYLTKKYGFSGLHIDTGAALIDKNVIDFIAPLAEKGIR